MYIKYKLTSIIMQHAHPNHPIIHILQPENIPQQAVAIHMAASESQRGSLLNFLDNALALHPPDGEADHGHAQFLAGGGFAVDGEEIFFTAKEIEEDRL